MKSSKFLLCILGLLFSTGVSAQFSLPVEILPAKSTELLPYLFPVYPGQRNFLAGTMGELRPTHFHAGIDVRTNNMVGVPILATQHGYISRIVVGTYGYGNALLIKHPDGYTSLYGHLDKFKGPIANHLLKEQYLNKVFDLDLTFEAMQFPINRGDTIGLSGNTGGSSGPHLHFEIRDSTNDALNPLDFGFPEIIDKIAPIAFKVALTTMDIDARINDRFGRYEFSLIRSGNNYTLPFPIFANGKIGVEILAHDKLEPSQFRCGINRIEMYLDSTLIFNQEINKINLEDSYDVVTLMDFKTLKTKGNRYNRLYVTDGNPLKIYKNIISKGTVKILNGTRQIKIKLRDHSGNESMVNFSLKYDPIINVVPFLETMAKPIEYEIFDNTMIINSKICPASNFSKSILFSTNTEQELIPAYANVSRQVYLIDLRKTLPDSFKTCTSSLKFNLKNLVPSGTDYDYYSDLLDIKFLNGNLYDTLYLNTTYESIHGREKFTIGLPTIPIHKTISVTLKPTNQYLAGKTSVYHLEGKRFEYLGGNWVNARIQFNTHEFGDFTLLTDSIPPSIGRIYCNGNSARFRISDNLSGISSFETTINGQWLLMKYDYKTGIIQSEKLDRKLLLKGNFELKVIDRAGNERIYQQKIL